MSDADIEWLYDARDVFRYALYVWYSCFCRRSCVVVSFDSSSRSVSVMLDEIIVVVVLSKKHGQGTSSCRSLLLRSSGKSPISSGFVWSGCRMTRPVICRYVSVCC